MDGIVQIVLAVITLLSGGSAFASFLLYRKQSTRIKTAEAFESEVKALRLEIDALKEQINFERTCREEDKKTILTLETHNTQLIEDKAATEIKHARNKKALNRAYECTHCASTNDCPVIKQRLVNEEEYLKELERKKK